jgi:hypothetical protein
VLGGGRPEAWAGGGNTGGQYKGNIPIDCRGGAKQLDNYTAFGVTPSNFEGLTRNGTYMYRSNYRTSVYKVL